MIPDARWVKPMVAINAAVFLGLGAWLAIDPLGALAGVQVGATGPLGLTELRAMYGGLDLGLGAFCLHALRRPALAPAALWVSFYALAGLGSLRLGGILFTDGGAPLMWGLFAAELSGALANGWVLMRSKG